MLPGKYVFDTFHTKNMRNERIRTYLHLQAIDATGKRASFLDGYATYGKSIEKEIGNLDLQNTIAPVYCTITDGPGGKEFQILKLYICSENGSLEFVFITGFECERILFVQCS